MLKNYVKYLRETLGVKYIPLGVEELASEVMPSYSMKDIPQYTVVFFSQSPFSLEEMNLFEKMRSALGLTEESAPLVTLDRIADLNCEICVSFDALPDLGLSRVGDLSQVNNRKYVYLHSPQILIENSKLKKEAWELMKSQIGQFLPKVSLN